MNDTTNTNGNLTDCIPVRTELNDLAISTQDRVSEKIKDALDSNDAHRRWFWELLQNAKDTVAKQRQVSVNLKYARTLSNELTLVFEHSGNPFKPSSDPTRFDDLKNIVLTGSGKPPDKGLTGKFGTGFQSTQILSLFLTIDGAYQNEQGTYNFFEVTLDRTSFDGKEENRYKRIESISKSLADIKNFKNAPSDYSPSNTEFRTTKFTYLLEKNLRGLDWAKQIVEEGLKDIQQILPYTFAFVSEIDKVAITDEVLSKTITEFGISKTDHRGEIKITTITKKVTDLNGNLIFNPTPTIIIASLSNGLVEVATEITDENEIRLCDFKKQYQIETGKEFPIIFSSFPLIGSEEFHFPLVINSTSFKPKETRDGIELKSNNDDNQILIEGAVTLYEKFIEFASENQWNQIYLLARTAKFPIPDNHKWIGKLWYETSVLNSIRTKILFTPIVDVQTKNGTIERKAIKSATGQNQIFFPLTENKDKLYEFGKETFPNSLPVLADVENWNSVIWDDINFIKVNIEFIIRNIAQTKVENLAEHLFSDITKIEETLNWLYLLYDFIEMTFSDKTFLLFNYTINNNPYWIIPDRELKFQPLNKLKKDVGYNEEGLIDEMLLRIHSSLFIGINLREKLLHSKFSGILTTSENLKEVDVAAAIRDFIDTEFKKNSKYPSNFVTSLSDIYTWLSYEENQNEENNKRVNSAKGYFSDAVKRKILESIMPPGKEIYLTKLLELDREGKVDMARQTEILSDPELELKLNIGKSVLDKQREFRNNAAQGKHYENLFKSIMLQDDNYTTEKVEGEQDFVITNKATSKKYFVEIKSVGNLETKIRMIERQVKKAKQFPANYFLCVIRATDNPTEEYFKSNASFNGDIGNRLFSKVSKAEEFETPEPELTVEFEDELLEQFQMYRYKFGVGQQLWGQDNFDNFKSKLG